MLPVTPGGIDAGTGTGVHREVEQLELEGIAEAMLREGGQGDDDAPRLGALATRLLGPGSIDFAPTSLPGDAALVRIHDTWRIYVHRRLSPERHAFAVAHELAEWWLRMREGYRGQDLEHVANYVGAALMTPRRAFYRSLRAHGHDFPELAADFGTSQTLVALREAELIHMPRAVVSSALVRVRGPESWVWPEEETIRRWARAPAIGLRKVVLTDDRHRVVLDVDDADVG